MTPAVEVLLRVDDLSVVYGGDKPVRALSSVSFAVSQGEALGVVGESGSGKSTALKAILGMLGSNARIAGGRILLDGTDLVADPAAARAARGQSVTMIFQDPINSLNPSLTLGWQLGRLLALEEPDLSCPEREARILDVLKRVGVDGRGKLKSYPFEFSQGQIERVVIAAACLIRRPRVLLADEPTTSLDVTVEAQVLDLLHELREELDLAVVFVTHDLALVSEFCSRGVVMYAGRVVEETDVTQLLDTPGHPYTRRLLESVPSFPSDGRRLASISGEVPDLSERQEGCAFAPRCDSYLGRLCDEKVPDLLEVRLDQRAACHLYDRARLIRQGQGGPDAEEGQ